MAIEKRLIALEREGMSKKEDKSLLSFTGRKMQKKREEKSMIWPDQFWQDIKYAGSFVFTALFAWVFKKKRYIVKIKHDVIWNIKGKRGEP